MSEAENATAKTVATEKRGTSLLEGVANFFGTAGVVVLALLLVGLPIGALFLGRCWLIAWIVAHCFF